MNTELEAVCVALDQLGDALVASFPDARALSEQHGWNMPNVSGADLSRAAKSLSTTLRTFAPSKIEPVTSMQLSEIIQRMNYFRINVIPNGQGGNSYFMVISFQAMLASFETTFKPLLSWQALPKDSLPPALAKRVSSVNIAIEELETDSGELAERIRLINAAKQDVDTLALLITETKSTLGVAKRLETDATNVSAQLEVIRAKANSDLASIDGLVNRAKAEVDAALGAHRASTSHGLSQAYVEKELGCRSSMRWWTSGLMLALALGGFIGYSHYESISSSFEEGLSTIAIVKTCLAILGIAGSIWFAWLASLQVGYRFRLAEEYAIKAASARSYEAYRQEAARVDTFLEAKLLASLLARFDEAPLRLIDNETHGSPIHAFLNSAAFKTAIDGSKELKDSFIKFFSQPTNKP